MYGLLLKKAAVSPQQSHGLGFPAVPKGPACVVGLEFRLWGLHSRNLIWKPKKGPIKTTVLLKGHYMGFHVSFGECMGSGQQLLGRWASGDARLEVFFWRPYRALMVREDLNPQKQVN